MKILISGGGTGGHIYPAIAIADEIKKRNSKAKFLFVGAKDRMEMQKVPQAGYQIKGLWISGIQRKLTFKNLLFPLKLICSLIKSWYIILKFKPDVVIGTGGFASGAVLYIATFKKIPTLIQEQNSYPGITNKLLAKRVHKICVAYDNLERFFPKNKIIKTGNPVRDDIVSFENNFENAYTHFGFDKNKKTVLVLGGSLGAKVINEIIKNNLQWFEKNGVQLLWQCGKLYAKDFKNTVKSHNKDLIKLYEFITDMDKAYSVADMIVSRSGASTVSELAIIGKLPIFIPSPFVAEDHQTKNAKALTDKKAALLLSQKNIERLPQLLENYLFDKTQREQLEKNLKQIALPNATQDIVDEVFKIFK